MADAHRRDIDGLRAVAILPVLFYHAKIWPFEAGYVGVDVFFVISGYLITGLILRAQDRGNFSLRGFYDRRIRRILPALFAVLLLASVAAPFLLLPDELVSYGKNLLGAVTFSANFVNWLRNTAYFAPVGEQNPLLHIWSLAVEEQFYLLWPLLLIALARFRRFLPAVIAVGAMASFAIALFFAGSQPGISFYLLPGRAFQLLAGAFLAAGAVPKLRAPLLRNGVAIMGLAFVAVAAIAPGYLAAYHPWNAVGATLGTALILLALDGGPNLVGAALATRIPVGIGLISYSLYLWHWPMLVYARLFANRELTLAETGGVLLAALGVSILSWRFVEQPIRSRAAIWRGQPVSFPLAAAAALPLLAVAAFFVLAQGLPDRLPPDVRATYAEAMASFGTKFCPLPNRTAHCVQGAFEREAVLWGDSHAQALAPGLIPFAAARHLTLREITRGACPPLAGADLMWEGVPFVPCSTFNREVLSSILASRNVRLVILQARWQALFTGDRLSRDSKTAAAIFAAALGRLLDALDRHRISVLVIGDVPSFFAPPIQCYGRQNLPGRDPRRCMGQSRDVALPPLETADRLLAEVVRPRARFVRYYRAFDERCDPDCRAFSAGHALYSDDHHITPKGASLIGQGVARALPNWAR